MIDKRNYIQSSKPKSSYRINTINNHKKKIGKDNTNRSDVSVAYSVQSGGTTPIDIKIMTGNGESKDGE